MEDRVRGAESGNKQQRATDKTSRPAVADPRTAGILDLQRSAGNRAVTALLTATAQDTLQRAIGDAGKAAIGKSVRKNQKAAAWKVLAAEQTNSGVWRYQIQDKSGFTTPEWVAADDDKYDLVETVSITPEQQTAITYMTPLLRANLAGSPAPWLNNKPASEVAGVAFMGEQQSTKGFRVLWSGGAADCIIIAAHANKDGYITHADRSGPSMSTIKSAIEGLGGAHVRTWHRPCSVRVRPKHRGVISCAACSQC
jgi:hypothetical protein